MNDNASVVSIILLLACIGMLIYANIKKVSSETCNEGYQKCLCSSDDSGRGRSCQDDDVAISMYDSGKATEYTEFPDKGWSKSSPGDMTFPDAKGCRLGACGPETQGWVAWDYEDL
jgi:hypothetical protein